MSKRPNFGGPKKQSGSRGKTSGGGRTSPGRTSSGRSSSGRTSSRRASRDEFEKSPRELERASRSYVDRAEHERQKQAEFVEEFQDSEIDAESIENIEDADFKAYMTGLGNEDADAYAEAPSPYMATSKFSDSDFIEAVDRTFLLDTFKEAQRPLRMDPLLRMLGLPRKQKRNLEAQLDSLQSAGLVLRLRGGSWGLVEHLKLITGRLTVQRTGIGFVQPEDRNRDDIYVHPSQMGEAWHGDKVAVVLLPGARGKSAEGRIVRILERATSELPARIVKRMGKGNFLCRAADARMRVHLLADLSHIEGRPHKDDIVVLEPQERIEDGLWAAKAIRLLGTEDNATVQERLVKINHGVPMEFPQAVLDEAASFPHAPLEADVEQRIDLRHLEFVTIDGAKARDFDDAIYVEEQGNGWRLWVAIADVSHYVKPDCAMDREAIERSNSYYFPQSVEPMLPEALSNGLCSLNPRVPRMVMVAEMYFHCDGSYGKSKFYPAVIESKARLTYGQVQRALLLKQEQERLNVRPVLPMLEQAEALARVLHDMRRNRGSLDFDLPEPELAFNIYGETTDIRRRERHFGHQIVEEFMIAANESVARFLTEKDADFLYRIHPAPAPEKLGSLFKALSQTDFVQDMPSLPALSDKGEAPQASPDTLQAILKKARGTDHEFLVSRLTLRTMMQARYTPEHEGHFGLASDCYCHFTSPIRRYADLVVHRALKHALGLGAEAGPIPAGGRLEAIGDQLSNNERKAMEAEREILKRYTVMYLRDRVDEEFTGVISSILDFGFFVELNEVLADGMVRLSSLDDDYYTFNPEKQELMGDRTGRMFRLGQKVKVRLTDVNVVRLEVNFELLDSDDIAPKQDDFGKRPSRSKFHKEPKKETKTEFKKGKKRDVIKQDSGAPVPPWIAKQDGAREPKKRDQKERQHESFTTKDSRKKSWKSKNQEAHNGRSAQFGRERATKQDDLFADEAALQQLFIEDDPRDTTRTKKRRVQDDFVAGNHDSRPDRSDRPEDERNYDDTPRRDGHKNHGKRFSKKKSGPKPLAHKGKKRSK